MSWNTTPLHSNPMVIGRCWLPSDRGWIKLNMDGAGSSNVPNACIGGVFRDFDANLLYDYSIVVGKDSTFRVEARAVLEELRIVWEKSFRQIDVECDNVLLWWWTAPVLRNSGRVTATPPADSTADDLEPLFDYRRVQPLNIVCLD
ncbi:hypothetical protein Golob_011627, partial [Gossypium lobatum]|nr:hypothetical protein [Gossypium lobatum]